MTTKLTEKSLELASETIGLCAEHLLLKEKLRRIIAAHDYYKKHLTGEAMALLTDAIEAGIVSEETDTV